MSNIFIFRHGECFASDSENEKLSPEGIKQAEKAGEMIADKLNTLYLSLIEGKSVDDLRWNELKGLSKVCSGRPRTLEFLEIIYNVANECFNGQLGFEGDKIEIKSSGIYGDSGKEYFEKLKQIINQCFPLAGIQLIVGHDPSTAYIANHYVEQGFNFEGDKRFLKRTSKGSGYWITDTLEKKVEVIN